MERYADKFVHSIKKQFKSTDNVFILLISDHSTDKTTGILKSAFLENENIIFVDSYGHGVSAARNTGLKNLYQQCDDCENKWVMFCDFDDLFSYSVYSILYNVKQVNEYDYIAFGYTTSQTNLEYKLANNISRLDSIDFIDRAISGPVYIDSYNYNFNSPWAKIFKLSFLRKSNIFFDEELSFREDLLFNLTIFKLSPRIGLVNRNYYYYYINPNSVVHRYIENTLEQNDIIFRSFEYLFKASGYLNYSNLESKLLSKILIQSIFVFVFPTKGVNNSYISSKKRFKKLRESRSSQYYLIDLKVTHKDSTLKNRIIIFLYKRNYFLMMYLTMQIKNKLKR